MKQKTYLLLGDRIIDKLQVCELQPAGEHIEVGQLGDLVRREGQVLKIGNCAWQVRLDGSNLVAGEQESLDARREGEIAQDMDVIVG